MKTLGVLVIVLFSFLAQAEGTCTATEIGYDAMCAAQPNEYACKAFSECAWASNGVGSCNARELGYESMCAAQPVKAACEAFSQCFWACQNIGACY